MRYNLYNKLLLQLRCNDLDSTIKASTCTTSKYYSYMFYADRNVRPCTILGYTLTTFPKSLTQTKITKRTSTELRAVKEEGPCKLLISIVTYLLGYSSKSIYKVIQPFCSWIPFHIFPCHSLLLYCTTYWVVFCCEQRQHLFVFLYCFGLIITSGILHCVPKSGLAFE